MCIKYSVERGCALLKLGLHDSCHNFFAEDTVTGMDPAGPPHLNCGYMYFLILILFIGQRVPKASKHRQTFSKISSENERGEHYSCIDF